MAKVMSCKYRVFVEKSGFFTSATGKDCPLKLSIDKRSRVRTRVRTGLLTAGGSNKVVSATEVYLDAYPGAKKLPKYDDPAYQDWYADKYAERKGLGTRVMVGKAVKVLEKNPNATYVDLQKVVSVDQYRAMKYMTAARKKMGTKRDNKKRKTLLNARKCHGWVDNTGKHHECPDGAYTNGEYWCNACRSVRGKSVSEANRLRKEGYRINVNCHTEDDFRAGQIK